MRASRKLWASGDPHPPALGQGEPGRGLQGPSSAQGRRWGRKQPSRVCAALASPARQTEPRAGRPRQERDLGGPTLCSPPLLVALAPVMAGSSVVTSARRFMTHGRLKAEHTAWLAPFC